MNFLERIGPALPPWSTAISTAVTTVATVAVASWVWLSSDAKSYWLSLVERTGAIAGTLLSVHASLLGFALATFAVILSVRRDKELQDLAKFEHATVQMWGALSSASMATGMASVVSLFVMLFNGAVFATWFQYVLAASLFVTTFYVTLTFVGVLTVVHSLVIMLRPRVTRARHRDDDDATGAFSTLGPPNEH
jgi:hypothetical protein